MTAFSEELEMEFKEMAFVLENAERGCWIYAVYNQAIAREEIIKRLKSEIELPFFLWDYSEEKPYPINYLRDLTEEQKQNRAIVSFFNTVDGGEKTVKSLDFNREKFAQYPHSLIFWVTENELGEMARKAGHFWAQRRGTFNFSKLAITQSEQNIPYSMGEWLNNLLNIENYQEALSQLEFYQKLLTEYPPVEQASPNTQRLIAETNDKTSYLLFYLGRYPEGIDFCEKALSLYKTLLGETDYSTIATSNNLALLYLQSRHLIETESLLQKILLILEKRTNYMPAMATVLNNLATLYGEQGKYTEAESLYQQSLVIRESILGKNHPDVARSLNNLACLYYEQSKYTEVEYLYKRSSAILEKTLRENHPDIATSLNNLAWIYKLQGKFELAEPLYQKSLAIREKILGIEHPKTKKVKANYETFLAEKAAREKSNQP